MVKNTSSPIGCFVVGFSVEETRFTGEGEAVTIVDKFKAIAALRAIIITPIHLHTILRGKPIVHVRWDGVWHPCKFLDKCLTKQYLITVLFTFT